MLIIHGFLGCKDYIQEQNLDVEIDIFQSFGNFIMDDKHNIGEYNIIELPDLKKYDGIILEITNTIMKDQHDRIVRKVIESDVPAVSLLEAIRDYTVQLLIIMVRCVK